MNYMTDANAIAAQLRCKAPARRKKATAASGLQLQVLDYMHAFLHVQTLLRLGFLERNAVGKLRFARGGDAC